MPAKRKTPAQKRRTAPTKAPAAALSAEQASRQQSKRILAVAAVAALCLAVAGIILNSATGFWYERQSFPGAQDPQVANGRSAVEARVTNAFLDNLQTLPAGGTITPVLQHRTDMCLKGQHDPGPFGRVDPWAYDCQLTYEGSFSYTAPACDVIHLLVAANISVSYRDTVIGQGCATGVSQLQARSGDSRRYTSTNSQIAAWAADVDTAADFLSNPSNLSSVDLPNCGGGSSTVVYCQRRDTGQAVIPADTQTIVSYYIDDSYYTK